MILLKKHSLQSFPILLLCLCTGCSLLPSNATQSAATVAEDLNQSVLQALQQVQRIANAPVEEQRHEVAAAQQAFQRDKSPLRRLQLGLLLAQPNIAGNDEGRALTLLESLHAHSNASVRALAAMTTEQLAERQRHGKKIKALQDQLDELKAMERSLIERSSTQKK